MPNAPPGSVPGSTAGKCSPPRLTGHHRQQPGAHREDLPHPDGPVTTNTPPVSPFQRGTQQLGQFRHLAAAAEEQPMHVRVKGATRGTGSARPPSPAPRTRQADAQSAQQRARRGGTVTMSGSDATDGAGSAAAERPQHTPTPRAGQAARQKDLFGHLWGRHHRHDTGLHSCRPALATTADVNSGHFVVQDANSVCPPSRRCRPKPAVGGWCSPTPRPLDMEISLIVVVMTPRSTGTDWASASPVTATPAVNGIWSGAQTPGWAAARSRTHEPGQTISSPHGSDGTDRSPPPIRSTTGRGPTRPAPRVGQGGTVRAPPPRSSRRRGVRNLPRSGRPCRQTGAGRPG